MSRLALAIVAMWCLLSLVGPLQAKESDEVTGKVKSVNGDKNELVVTDKDGKDFTFHLADNAKVKIGDKESKLSDLKEGDELRVKYERKGDRFVASEIRLEKK
jgi:Cu/Ag efflux protein CusF